MDITLRKDLERIASIYREHELREDYIQYGKSVWVPTPLDVLLQEVATIDHWCRKEDRKHEGKALVAGAGDGRRAVYLSKLGYYVAAIELNPKLATQFRCIMGILSQQGLADTSKVTMVEDDALDDNTYLTRGLVFHEFQKIFGYLKKENLEALANKIKRESPGGTEFFNLSFMQRSPPEIGLQFVRRKRIGWRGPEPGQVGYYMLFQYRK